MPSADLQDILHSSSAVGLVDTTLKAMQYVVPYTCGKYPVSRMLALAVPLTTQNVTTLGCFLSVSMPARRMALLQQVPAAKGLRCRPSLCSHWA